MKRPDLETVIVTAECAAIILIVLWGFFDTTGVPEKMTAQAPVAVFGLMAFQIIFVTAACACFGYWRWIKAAVELLKWIFQIPAIIEDYFTSTPAPHNQKSCKQKTKNQ